MAKFLKNLMDSLKYQDDDDDDYDYESEENEKDYKKDKDYKDKPDIRQRRTERQERYDSDRSAQTRQETERPAQPQRAHTSSNYGSSTYIENRNGAGKAIRMERPEGSKVIPISTTRRGLEVCIMKPKHFEDSQDICDVLLSGRAAIINLEDFDIVLSQRIMDFISGAVYSLNGKLYQISGFIFIVTPESVDISGDYNELIAQSGFEVPTLSKDF